MKFQAKSADDSAYKSAFLEVIEQEAFEVLTDLEELLPQFATIFENNDLPDLSVFQGFIGSKNYNSEKIFSFCYSPPKWIVRNDPSYDDRDASIENFDSFRLAFNQWIEKYCLQKIWLRKTAITTLWYWTKYENHPRTTFRLPALGPYDIPNYQSVNFETGWKFDLTDSIAFKKDAIKKFKVFIDAYVKETTEQAKKEGYKLIRRPKDYDQLKWLVWWNVNELSKDEILERSDEERGNKDGTSISTLNKAFRKFKKYDLPVRKE